MEHFYIHKYLSHIDIEEIIESESYGSVIEGIFKLVAENIRVTQNLHYLYSLKIENKNFIIEDIGEINECFHYTNDDIIIPFLESEFFVNPTDTKPKIEYLIMKYDMLISNLNSIKDSLTDEDIKLELFGLIQTLVMITHNLYSFCPGFDYTFKWNSDEWGLINYRKDNKQIESLINSKVSKSIWNLPTRFNLFNELGLLKIIQNSYEPRNEQDFIVSQLMGIHLDSAKKLINGTYTGSTNDTEQLECSQWINKHKTNKAK